MRQQSNDVAAMRREEYTSSYAVSSQDPAMQPGVVRKETAALIAPALGDSAATKGPSLQDADLLPHRPGLSGLVPSWTPP